MSILERIRSGTDAGPLNLLLWLVVATFVFWGAGMTSGTQTATVATVNGERINAIEFARAFDLSERQMAANRTEPMTQDEREALRERVLQDMIRQRALVQEAQAVGLEVSDAEVAEALLDVPFLLNDEGRFDRRAYEQFLRRQGKTRGDFEAELREQLLVSKLQELMILGASVADPIVRRRWIEDNTKLDLAYVRIRPGAFRQAITPDEATLDTWTAAHEAEIQDRYEADRARLYDQPATVSFTQIRLTAGGQDKGLAELKAEAEALAEQIAGGADMGALAQEHSDDPTAEVGGSRSDVRVDAMDAKLAAALEGLEPGALTAPIVGDNDVRLLRLDARSEAHTIPLEEVSKDIALALYREEEAPVAAAAFADKELLPSWKETGVPPTDVVEAKGLRVDSTGPIPASGTGGGLFRPPEAMLTDARAAAKGDVLPEVYDQGGVLWVGQLVSRDDPDPSVLDEDGAVIREQALLRRRVEFFQAWVDDVVAKADVTY